MTVKDKYHELINNLRSDVSREAKMVELQELYRLIDNCTEDEKNELLAEEPHVTLDRKEESLQDKILAAGLPSLDSFLNRNTVSF